MKKKKNTKFKSKAEPSQKPTTIVADTSSQFNKKLNPSINNQPKKQKDIDLCIEPLEYVKLGCKYLGNFPQNNKLSNERKYNDPRLKNLKGELFLNKTVLEIGCNEGFLSVEIAKRFFPEEMVGVDIDRKLIKNAIYKVDRMVEKDQQYKKRSASLQAIVNGKGKGQLKVEGNDKDKGEVEVKYKGKGQKIPRDKAKDKTQGQNEEMVDEKQQTQQQNQQQVPKTPVKVKKIKKLAKIPVKVESIQKPPQTPVKVKRIQDLPLFFQDRLKAEHTIESYLPHHVDFTPEALPQISTAQQFPRNLRFINENILNYEPQCRYDVIICFKVTRWIHLTYGLKGIRSLFEKIHKLLKYFFIYPTI